MGFSTPEKAFGAVRQQVYMVVGIEAIRGKPLPEKAENIIYTGGAAIVVMLMVFAIFNDISRFL